MRYAILLCGRPQRRHLNGLEFCYRALTERFGFKREHIQVLVHDGSLRAADGRAPDLWPGDASAYRLKVTGEGSRRAFAGALHGLSQRLTAQDSLFINTSGHGGNYGDGRGPYLTLYPHRDRYMVEELCAELSKLPAHRSLVVLMAQCFSGGFNRRLLDASPAKMTFIAAAAAETRLSHARPDDANWDAFQRGWLSAIAGRDVDGTPISDPCRAPGRAITVREAFFYACTYPPRNTEDCPEFAAKPDCASDLTLFAEESAG